MKNLSIIILHYGPIKTTQKCIESIRNNKISYSKLFIVDNLGNFDKKILRKLKHSNLIKTSSNLGFAGGVNVGIKVALKNKPSYILILNNDIYFTGRDIDSFHTYFNNKIGILGPTLKFEIKGRLFYDKGGTVDLIGKAKHKNETYLNEKSPYRVSFVSGACIYIKAEVFNKIGLFDESFFLYHEDVDFCLRAKKLGYLTHIVPTDDIYHGLSQAVGMESDRAFYHQTRSGLIYIKKHTQYLLFPVLLLITFKRILKNPKRVKAAYSGLIDGITNSLNSNMTI